MRVLSLCSGYMGIELGLEMAGVDVELVAYAEIDKYAAAIGAAHHPDVWNAGDIKTVDWDDLLCHTTVDILTAGYPCQPFSHAGKRLGTDDPRHLWPYVYKAICHLRPRLVFLENVRGHLTKGFDQVIADLADAGYVGSWCCVRASDIGAPHRRERVFILAADAKRSGERFDAGGSSQSQAGSYEGDVAGFYGGGWPATDTDSSGLSVDSERDSEPLGPRFQAPRGDNADGCAVADPDGEGLEGLWDSELLDGSDPGRGTGEGRRSEPSGDRWGAYAAAIKRWEDVIGREAPEPTVRRMAHGSPRGMGDGRISHTQQLKALGNGVVPLQAAAAFRLLYEVVVSECQNVAARSAVSSLSANATTDNLRADNDLSPVAIAHSPAPTVDSSLPSPLLGGGPNDTEELLAPSVEQEKTSTSIMSTTTSATTTQTTSSPSADLATNFSTGGQREHIGAEARPEEHNVCDTACSLDEAIDQDLAEAYADALIVGEGSGEPVGLETSERSDMVEDVIKETAGIHPAMFSEEIIDALREILPTVMGDLWCVHDPFAGPGNRLAALCEELGYWFTGCEIEEWPNTDWRVTRGDSTEAWTYPQKNFVIVTSPTYNNGVNDHFDPKDDSRRLTYRSRLGRPLHENNTGRYSGRASKGGEEAYWRLNEQCVALWPATVVVNVKDSIRSGSIYRLVDQWQAMLEDYGYTVERFDVECPGWRFGSNNEARVDTEAILIGRKGQ